jgi:predicted acyl esterase
MRRSLVPGLLLALWGGVSGSLVAPVWAATPTSIAMVPMRDGTLLATDVYLPTGTGPWPVTLSRTPYGRTDFRRSNGGHGAIPASRFLASGIARVVQDLRGAFDSQGEAGTNDDGWGERQDGLDTVNWIRKQSWSNGKIAAYGASSMGMTQLMLAGAGPEGVVGQHVRDAPGSLYLKVFLNGVWRKATNDAWFAGNPYALSTEPLLRAHPGYDQFWRDQDLGTRADRDHWPMLHKTGWYDIFLQDTLDIFTQLQEAGGDGARGRQHLVIGPWVHGGRGWSVDRGAGALTYPATSLLPPDMSNGFSWLSFWLTGQPVAVTDEPAVRYYVMGDVTDPQAPGNVWRTADRWPPPSQPLRLYFTTDGGLDPHPPATEGSREYDYDPLRPVPSVVVDWVPGEGPSGGQRDQRQVENWPDVLLFTTPPLAEPLEVTGRITVHLAAATTARDTAFTAKLTDVYPDGRSMLVTDGIVRASYRNSVEKAEFLPPGQRYAFDIDVGSTSLVFNRGHRIRVAISSSNYPRFDANRNNGRSWPADQNAPAVVAHQTIFPGGADGSAIVLPHVVAHCG